MNRRTAATTSSSSDSVAEAFSGRDHEVAALRMKPSRATAPREGQYLYRVRLLTPARAAMASMVAAARPPSSMRSPAAVSTASRTCSPCRAGIRGA